MYVETFIYICAFTNIHVKNLQMNTMHVLKKKTLFNERNNSMSRWFFDDYKNTNIKLMSSIKRTIHR